MRHRMQDVMRRTIAAAWMVLFLVLAQGIADAQVTARVKESVLDNGLKVLLLE